MQYILSEDEYKNLVPLYKYKEEMEKVEKLNNKILELTSKGKCRKENGGYCDTINLNRKGGKKKGRGVKKYKTNHYQEFCTRCGLLIKKK